MLLVMDVGNTNIKVGVFEGDKLINSWRMESKPGRTADEYAVTLLNILERAGLHVRQIEGVVMSSVIPSLNYTLEHMVEYYIRKPMIVAGPGVKSGINVKYENPKEVGADRIVNSLAAHRLYGGPCIVIDFGTATTFNVINEAGEFIGGVICPGIKLSTDALTNNAAKLPRIELIKPERVVGKSTVANMQSGIIYGFIGMVEYLVRKIKTETGFSNAKVIATGGFSELIAEEGHIIDRVDKTLTLTGLRFLYELNQ